eukprot:TRINITY_DN73624_c0_g1_i1.p1 TRINITY_DN73624_c0_g1~~TRINITY_DN73624_c0_g1_i1.p1  ORF type:complete len:205 (+),score=18.36 TRINITY_DN73624_c0_g1_i1:42-656(+)
MDVARVPRPSSVPRPCFGLNSQIDFVDRSATVPRHVKPLTSTTTTVVVHNLPCRLRQHDALLRLWPESVYKYTFLFRPTNCRRRRPSGYVFINFATPELAATFTNEWNGKALKNHKMQPITIGCATHQGFYANLLMSWRDLQDKVKPDQLPVVFQNGRRACFRMLVTSVIAAMNTQHVELPRVGSNDPDTSSDDDLTVSAIVSL